MSSLSRRRLLVGAGATAALLAAGGVTLLARSDESTVVPPAVADRLRGLFGSMDAVAPLGRDYLDAHPESTDALVRAVAPEGADPTVWFAATDDAEFARHVRSEVRREFANDEEVPVAGWLLAPTEARCCALAARVG